MKIEFDTKTMARALDEYGRATGKDMAYVTNRAAMNVALRASRETPKADAKAIRGLTKELWWNAFVNKELAREGVKATKQAVRAMGRKIIAARVRAINFTRAGWLPAAQILARKIGRPLRISNRKSFGTAMPASSFGFTPTTIIVNKTEGAPKVGGPALAEAFAYVASDMISFARRRMSDTARKHSAK